MRKQIISTMRCALFAAVVICAFMPVKGRAQVAGAARTGRPGVNSPTVYIGIDNLRCDCTFNPGINGSPRAFIFRSEPVVAGVAPASPASGLLETGDVITHIDGISLLTSEGGRRFGSIEPGDDVRLTIRRDDHTMRVSIHAEPPANRRTYGLIAPEAVPGTAAIWSIPPAEPAIPAEPGMPAPRAARAIAATPAPRVWAERTPRAVLAPQPPRAALPATPAPPAVPAAIAWSTPPGVPESPASPLGWFGFSIRCTDCGWASNGRPGVSPVWESHEPPEIYKVASSSPASRAGIQAGDRITHIDGLSIMSSEGARRFGGVEPGQRIRLTIKRGNATMVKVLRLTPRPEVTAAIAAVAATPARAPLAPSMRRELRYSGKMDNVSVQVWSPGGPTVEKIGDTMVITVGASVVRIKVDPKK